MAYRDASGNKVYDFNGQSIGQGQGLWYGELVYADLNGDGMYGTNNNDRFFTGKSTTPKYTYGLNISAAWKGIDLNMTWAGNAGMYYYIFERGFNNMSEKSWQEGTIIARNARNIFYYSNPEAAATDPSYDRLMILLPISMLRIRVSVIQRQHTVPIPVTCIMPHTSS